MGKENSQRKGDREKNVSEGVESKRGRMSCYLGSKSDGEEKRALLGRVVPW